MATENKWHDSNAHQTNVTRKAAVKRNLFKPWVEGDVLDIGCGGGYVGRPGEDGWVFADLDEMTDGDLVGLDIDKDAVESARQLGYDVRHVDAQDFDLDETFDTITLTNIIEHVANPGIVLENVADHLKPDGRALITTDRMLVPWWLLQTLKNGEPGPHPDHTMHFCREHLEELVSRVDMDVVHYESWGFDRVGLTSADRVWRQAERMLSRCPGLEEIDHVQHFFVVEAGGN